MEHLTIRPFCEADRSAVIELLREAGLPVEGLEGPLDEAFSVARFDGRLAGAAGLETYGRKGLLRSVVVPPHLRGRAIGTRIVQERLDHARSLGLEEVYLLTLDRAAFFARLGFRVLERSAVPAEIRRSPEFARLCPDSAVPMVIDIRR